MRLLKVYLITGTSMVIMAGLIITLKTDLSHSLPIIAQVGIQPDFGGCIASITSNIDIVSQRVSQHYLN